MYPSLYKYSREISIPDRSDSLWKKSLLKFDEEFNDVCFIDDNIGWCSLSWGELYKTINAGVSWFKVYQSKTTLFSSIYFFSEDEGYATTNGNLGTLLKTTDGGFSWSVSKSNIPTNMYFRKNKGFLFGKTILMSTDQGANWNFISAYLPSFRCNDIYFADDSTGWFCGQDMNTYKNMIYKTTDGGLSWNKIYEFTGIQYDQYSNITGFSDTNVLYITYSTIFHGIKGGGTLKSTDGGSTWTKFSGLGGDDIYFTSPQTGWVAGGQFTNEAWINKTTDGGMTWTPELRDNNGRFRKMYFHSNNVWVLGPGRMLNNKDRSIVDQIVFDRNISDTTISRGEKLVHQVSASGYPEPRFRLLRAPSSMKIDAVTGKIIWNCDIPGTHIIVVEAFNNFSTDSYSFTVRVNPENYKLFQNYPNPFNQGTVIRYHLPVPAFVSLKLYDIVGREVMTLVNKEQSVGEYEVAINGSGLSSGLYIYRLQSGSFVDAKKLVMIK